MPLFYAVKESFRVAKNRSRFHFKVVSFGSSHVHSDQFKFLDGDTRVFTWDSSPRAFCTQCCDFIITKLVSFRLRDDHVESMELTMGKIWLELI